MVVDGGRWPLLLVRTNKRLCIDLVGGWSAHKGELNNICIYFMISCIFIITCRVCCSQVSDYVYVVYIFGIIYWQHLMKARSPSAFHLRWIWVKNAITFPIDIVRLSMNRPMEMGSRQSRTKVICLDKTTKLTSAYEEFKEWRSLFVHQRHPNQK